MVEFKSILMKMVFTVLVPVIGIPLYSVAYTKMNDTFGAGTNSWAVDLFSITYILVFAGTPLGLMYSIYQDLK